MARQTLKPDDLIVNSLTAFFADVGNLNLDSRRNLAQDLKTICNRLGTEGLGFVTKTLPKLGKHFDAALRDGKFSTLCSFRRNKRGVLPSFLKGLLEKVFDRESGKLHTHPNIEAIKAIRQICFMFYKLEGEYPEKLVDEILQGFKEVDHSLCECDSITPDKAGVINIANDFLKAIFADFDHKDIVPRPGPGQTACKTPHWDRFEPHVHYHNVHEAYPYYSYFYCSPVHLQDRVDSYKSMPRLQFGTSKVTTVPKDSRGPRIICMVPHEYMWLQQGLGRALTDLFQRHPFTRGHVNFDDQTINGRLALEGSRLQNYATLDMKEASDRISTSLVDAVFDGIAVKDALLALSTPEYEFPDGSKITAKKFAPMGSALCFPIMSIVHYALSVASLVVRGWSLHRARKAVYVYGDDIIATTEAYPALLEEFPIYGLKFNIDKCFCTGKFRESCGVDAFDGVNVTPIRVKKHVYSKKSGADFKSICDISNNLMEKGYWRTSEYFEILARKIYGNIPYVTPNASLVGFTVPYEERELLNPTQKVRFCDELQCEYVLGRVVKTGQTASFWGHWEQLLRSLNHSRDDSVAFFGRDHVKMRWSWVPQSSA